MTCNARLNANSMCCWYGNDKVTNMSSAAFGTSNSTSFHAMQMLQHVPDAAIMHTMKLIAALFCSTISSSSAVMGWALVSQPLHFWLFRI